MPSRLPSLSALDTASLPQPAREPERSPDGSEGPFAGLMAHYTAPPNVQAPSYEAEASQGADRVEAQAPARKAGLAAPSEGTSPELKGPRPSPDSVETKAAASPAVGAVPAPPPTKESVATSLAPLPAPGPQLAPPAVAELPQPGLQGSTPAPTPYAESLPPAVPLPPPSGPGAGMPPAVLPDPTAALPSPEAPLNPSGATPAMASVTAPTPPSRPQLEPGQAVPAHRPAAPLPPGLISMAPLPPVQGTPPASPTPVVPPAPLPPGIVRIEDLQAGSAPVAPAPGLTTRDLPALEGPYYPRAGDPELNPGPASLAVGASLENHPLFPSLQVQAQGPKGPSLLGTPLRAPFRNLGPAGLTAAENPMSPPSAFPQVNPLAEGGAEAAVSVPPVLSQSAAALVAAPQEQSGSGLADAPVPAETPALVEPPAGFSARLNAQTALKAPTVLPEGIPDPGAMVSASATPASTPMALNPGKAIRLSPTAQEPSPLAKVSAREGKEASIKPSQEPAATRRSSEPPAATSAEPVKTAATAREPQGAAQFPTEAPLSSSPSLTATGTLSTPMLPPQPGSIAAPLSPATPAAPAHPVAIQVGDSLKWILRQASPTAELQLHPENLGKVTIQLKVDGTQVHAKVWASEAATLPVLQDHRAYLEVSLRQQGLNLGSFDLQQGHGGYQPQGDPGSRPAFGPSPEEKAALARQETPTALAPTFASSHRIEVLA